MNIRTELPQLAALQQSTSIEVHENLAFYHDNCYNSDFLEQQYGELVRNLIADCIERGQLDRRQLQDKLRDVFDQTSLSSEECARIAMGVLKERFRKAAIQPFEAAFDASAPPVGMQQSKLSPGASEADNASGLSLPEAAPELYQNRARPESPIAFFDRVWRSYVDAGVLYQDQLRQLDPKLIPAIHTYCSKRDIDPKEHLPPPRHERTLRLAATGDKLAQNYLKEAERKRALRAAGIEP